MRYRDSEMEHPQIHGSGDILSGVMRPTACHWPWAMQCVTHHCTTHQQCTDTHPGWWWMPTACYEMQMYWMYPDAIPQIHDLRMTIQDVSLSRDMTCHDSVDQHSGCMVPLHAVIAHAIHRTATTSTVYAHSRRTQHQGHRVS